MKLLRFNDDRIGVLKDGDLVVDVSRVILYREDKGPQRVIEEVIEKFAGYRRDFERIADQEGGIPLNSVKLLAPVPRPSKCLAAFSNYLDRPNKHPDMPIDFFYKAPELVGPGGTIELLDIPPVSVYQPEAELALVIGKKARNVSEAAAMDSVFGFVPFFDISARGLTRRTQLLSKGQAAYGPCGPWITTKDEVPDPHDLTIMSWVNGELRQNFSTRCMAHKIPTLVAWLSRFVELQPGDVVSTGGHHDGLGPINDGDILEIEIERLGKTLFFVKGYGPRKEVEWSQPPGARGGGQPLSKI